jgi:hypothetical protein
VRAAAFAAAALGPTACGEDDDVGKDPTEDARTVETDAAEDARVIPPHAAPGR